MGKLWKCSRRKNQILPKNSKAHKACHGFSHVQWCLSGGWIWKAGALWNTTWRAWLRAFPWRKKPSLSKPMACWRVWGPRDGLGWCWHTLGVADVVCHITCLSFAIGWTQKTFQIKGEPKGSHRVSNELGVKCFSADDAHYKNCVAESQRYTMYDISKSQNQSCKISTLEPLIDTILRVYTVCNQVYVLHNCMCKFKGISFARNPVDLRECATPLPKSTKHLMSNLVKLGMLLFL